MNNDLDEGPNCLTAQECRGDFWLMLEQAMEQCGGNKNLVLKNMDIDYLDVHVKCLANQKLRDVVETLAQNGIRMVYIPEKHMDRICH